MHDRLELILDSIHSTHSQNLTACMHRGAAGRARRRRSGKLPRHVRRRLASRYVAHLPGGRWRRTRHAGGPTGRAPSVCPGSVRQGATAGPGVVRHDAPFSGSDQHEQMQPILPF